MLSKSDATLFDGDTVAELVTELVDMKRRSGAPDAETDLKIVLEYNNDGPSDINNQTLTKHRIQKLQSLEACCLCAPHLGATFGVRVINLTPRTGELRSAPSWPDARHRVAGREP